MGILLPNKNSPLECFRVFSEVDYIVSDIDGTLTVGSAPVFEQIKKQTNYLKKKNVITTIATGRPYRGAYKVIHELGITDGTTVILYNGGVLLAHRTGDIIKKNIIDNYEAKTIFDLVAECGAGIYVYACELYLPNVYNLLGGCKLEEIVYYAGLKKRFVDVNGFQVVQLNDSILQEKSIVSILIEKEELSTTVKKKVMEYLLSDSAITYTDSGGGFIEIRAVEGKKSSVIDVLRTQNKYEKLNKILAIGDNDNDIDMFESADISVAVKNASMMAKRVADYICERDHAAGYLDMLMVIEQAKRYF